MKSIDDMIETLDKCKTAHNILQEIWCESSPYEMVISDKVKYKIQNYFNFDDSE